MFKLNSLRNNYQFNLQKMLIVSMIILIIIFLNLIMKKEIVFKVLQKI